MFATRSTRRPSAVAPGVPDRGGPRPPGLEGRRTLVERRPIGGIRIEDDVAGLPVDGDLERPGCGRAERGEDAGGPHHGGDAEAAGEDAGVGGARAAFQDDSRSSPAGISAVTDGGRSSATAIDGASGRARRSPRSRIRAMRAPTSRTSAARAASSSSSSAARTSAAASAAAVTASAGGVPPAARSTASSTRLGLTARSAWPSKIPASSSRPVSRTRAASASSSAAAVSTAARTAAAGSAWTGAAAGSRVRSP